MNKHECNYDVHDKELLAIVKALLHWRKYLIQAEHRIRILTDHQNLVPFTTTKTLLGRQCRWSEILSQYWIKIEYRPGREGGKPDALTRREGDLRRITMRESNKERESDYQRKDISTRWKYGN